MQYVLRTPDIVVKVTNREDTLHVGGEEGGGGGVGGHLVVKCFEHENCLLSSSANRNPILSKHVQKTTHTSSPRITRHIREL